ncbi:ABC transporter ATP-binding protein [Oceanibacterium hippocampi]|uniref:High-affinity branched-chain amino acid transport ATP-binding protein LivF n=1 Tax=Oceanibacterium hippocampi TaxID=745714 RepID=A0A1Y5S076_9PROT|nr:ABC transporter ATP-binding protein [Oceanibacterium hippocampi]SLN26974.1 High-affinity branched-chain amino acid transport ATP-binding protein LivF [Oceanibacterium hippocampi]
MLTVSDLRAGYSRGADVLKGLRFDVAKGESVALMGRNGMGKTTFVKALMGCLPHVRGSITFNGTEIRGLPPYRISNLGIAYVPQGREIFGDFTVAENLAMGVIGKPLKVDSVDFVFDYFPILAERRTQLAGTMSGGQQQQLAIARALVGRPQLLLLDEPSEGIQPSIVQDIAMTLKRIAAEEALTVIVVEQNIDLVFRLATSVRFIENGLIKTGVSIDEVRSDPTLVSRYLTV